MLRYQVRRALAGMLRMLPPKLNYAARAVLEKLTFRRVDNVHALPPIFHYWSNKYLRPRFEELGFSSPDDFFAKYIERELRNAGRSLSILSLGSGHCDLEIALARHLATAAAGDFRVTCLDINNGMLARGRERAQAAGVAASMEFRCGDINQLALVGSYDVVIANQCLHHFTRLEEIFAAIAQLIGPRGLFLTSDMIGRNGHQLWPEALAKVEQIWQSLPPRLQYDNVLRRQCPRYVNYNHADVAFEGVRAQDILPLLLSRFEFELFAPYACMVLPFVDRRYGWNFDADNADDRALIDRIASADEQAIASGELMPTQLIAALRPTKVAKQTRLGQRTPEQSVRHD